MKSAGPSKIPYNMATRRVNIDKKFSNWNNWILICSPCGTKKAKHKSQQLEGKLMNLFLDTLKMRYLGNGL